MFQGIEFFNHFHVKNHWVYNYCSGLKNPENTTKKCNIAETYRHLDANVLKKVKMIYRPQPEAVIEIQLSETFATLQFWLPGKPSSIVVNAVIGK